MILPNIKTKEELVEFCNNSLKKAKHPSIKWEFCGRCSLRKICKPLAGSNYQKWKEDVFQVIILENRKEKLSKLLKDE